MTNDVFLRLDETSRRQNDQPAKPTTKDNA
jgi:hypothetical protein